MKIIDNRSFYMDIEKIREYTKIYIDSLQYGNAFRDEAYINRQIERIARAEKLEQYIKSKFDKLVVKW